VWEYSIDITIYVVIAREARHRQGQPLRLSRGHKQRNKSQSMSQPSPLSVSQRANDWTAVRLGWGWGCAPLRRCRNSYVWLVTDWATASSESLYTGTSYYTRRDRDGRVYSCNAATALNQQPASWGARPNTPS